MSNRMPLTLQRSGRMFQNQPLSAASAASVATAPSIGSASTCMTDGQGAVNINFVVLHC